MGNGAMANNGDTAGVSAPPATDHRARLRSWLTASAYQTWSLVAVTGAAESLDLTHAEVTNGLVRLAAAGEIELKAIQAPELYRYRVT